MPELSPALLKALNLLTIAGGIIFLTQILIFGYSSLGSQKTPLGSRTTPVTNRLFLASCLVFLTVSSGAALASMIKTGLPMVASPNLLPFVAFGMTIVAMTIVQGWWYSLLRLFPRNNGSSGSGGNTSGRPAPLEPKTPVLSSQDTKPHPSEA